MLSTQARALAVVFAMMLARTPAHADSPWTEGVSDDQKLQAKTLLDAGNALLIEKKYVEALEKYTAAVAVWDHPAIRFNMVRCEIQLGKNLEAFEDLEKSLRYGAAPLEDTVYNEALAYQKLLASQVGELAIACEQPDVQLTLDGKPLAACPTKKTMRVLAGPHQIVGTKAGLLPRTLELVVVGGKTETADVRLDPLAKGARIEHRWPQYVPYTVFGGGIAVGAVGILFQVLGSSQMKEYDRWVDTRCTGNCTGAELADVQHLYDGAKLKSAVGVSLMITGGVGVAAGAVMVYLNRGRTVYPEVTPIAGGGAAVSWHGSF
jgi:tetratricopeptide (TPR) repeat protein